MQGFAVRLHQKTQKKQLACNALAIIQLLGSKAAKNNHHSNFIIYDACEVPVEYVNGKPLADKTTYVITAHYTRHRVRSSELEHIQVADTVEISETSNDVNDLVDKLYSSLYSDAKYINITSSTTINPVVNNNDSSTYFSSANTSGPVLFVARDNSVLPSIEECMQLLSVMEVQITASDILAVVKCAAAKIEAVTLSYNAGANVLTSEVTVPVTPDREIFSKLLTDAVHTVVVARDAQCVKLNYVFPKSIRGADTYFIRKSLKELVTRYYVSAKQHYDLSGVSIEVNFIFTGQLDTNQYGYAFTGSIGVTNSIECQTNKFTQADVREILAVSFGAPLDTPVSVSNATHCIEKVVWVGDTDVPENVVMATKVLQLTKDVLTRHRPMTTHVFTFSNKSDGEYLEYHNTYSESSTKNCLMLNKALNNDFVLSMQLEQLVVASTINPIFSTGAKRYYYSESITD